MARLRGAGGGLGLFLRGLDAFRKFHLDHNPSVGFALGLGAPGRAEALHELVEALDGRVLSGLLQDGNAAVGGERDGAGTRER